MDRFPRVGALSALGLIVLVVAAIGAVTLPASAYQAGCRIEAPAAQAGTSLHP